MDFNYPLIFFGLISISLGCGEARFTGINFDKTNIINRIPEKETTPLPNTVAPPSEEPPKQSIGSTDLGAGALTCSDQPELCLSTSESCPPNTLEVLIENKKMCQQEQNRMGCAKPKVLDLETSICVDPPIECSANQLWDPLSKSCKEKPITVAEKTCPDDPTKCNKIEDFFVPDSTIPGAIDIAWFVDSSQSMVPKKDIILKNISLFMEKITEYANLRVALVTKINSSRDTLPTLSGVKLMTVNVDAYIDSNTPLSVAAATSCPAELSSTGGSATATQGLVCGKNVVWGNQNMWIADHIAQAAGCLYEGKNKRWPNSCPLPTGTSFFRNYTKRVYIFATDDTNNGFNSLDFLKVVKPLMNGGTSGLAACEKTKTCNIPMGFVFGANNRTRDFCGNYGWVYSKAYVDLVKWTGGVYSFEDPTFPFFNVCNPNWGPYFDYMLKQVLKVAVDTLVTSKPVLPGSISVRVLETYYKEVNGQLVEDVSKRTSVTSTNTTKNRLLILGKDYTLEGNRIILREGSITLPTKPNQLGQIVRVFYRTLN